MLSAGTKPAALDAVVADGVAETARLEEADRTAEETAEGWAELNEATTEELTAETTEAADVAAEETSDETAGVSEDAEATADVTTEGEESSEDVDEADSVGEVSSVLLDVGTLGVKGPIGPEVVVSADEDVAVAVTPLVVLLAVAEESADSLTPGQPPIQF